MEPDRAKVIINNELMRRIADLDALRRKELGKLDEARRAQIVAEGWARDYQILIDRLHDAVAALDL